MRVVRLAGIAVLLAALLLTAAPARSAEAKGNCQTIAQIAASNADFSTLVAALQAAGLVDSLNGKGQFTVFAPTNAAFAALPPDAVAALLSDVPALTNVLLFHVARGNRDAADVLASSQIRMLNGDRAAVTLDPAAIDGAPIVATNIRACNGVIHVVSAVMLP